jgi:hypothetical protein
MRIASSGALIALDGLKMGWRTPRRSSTWLFKTILIASPNCFKPIVLILLVDLAKHS